MSASGAGLRRRLVPLLLATTLVAGALAVGPPPAAAPAAAAEVGAPTTLTVDGLTGPVDVDLDTPRLAWQLSAGEQRAFQIQVAASLPALDDEVLVWESGRVTSPAQSVDYAGPPLAPSEGYFWRVRTWGSRGVTPWSAPAHFGTGPSTGWADATPIWAPQGSPWSDYTFEATFRVSMVAAGLVFRARNTANYYLWQFRTANNTTNPNTLVPHVKQGGSFSARSPVALPAPLLPGTDHRVRIQVVGATITTWLDGVQIDVRTDATHASGTVGVRTGSSEAFDVDDVVVTGADGTSLYRNDFSQSSGSCGSVVAGRLTVGPGTDCLLTDESVDWAFLRGEVTLPDKPVAWAHVFATGSSPEPARQYVYKLWLNGGFVGLGPTRSIGREVRYDGFDVTSRLRPGPNALGAIAYTTTDQRFLALLVVRYADGTTQTFGTGPAWQAMRGAEVFPAAGSIGTGYYAAPKENLQSARFPSGFDAPGFDASSWSPPVVKPPFTALAATPTAKVVEQLRAPVEVREVSPGSYRIDYGRTWIGGLSLDVDGTEGQVVDIRYGEARNADGSADHTLATGNTYQDLWTLRDGAQHLETWGMRVFRYVDVIGAPSGMTGADFPALALVYPFEAGAADFDSSSSGLNEVWTLSRNTIESLNLNLYADSYTRERENYEADAYLQQLAHLYLSADATLGNYSLDYFTEGRRTWPTEWPLYVILGHHAAWQQTGETAALAANYSDLEAKLPDQWLEASTGLVRKDSRSNGCNSQTDCDIVDWPSGERDGYVFRPYNTVINALAYRAYADMAEIAAALGRNDDAAAFQATAQRLRQAINDRLWDPQKGAYRDGLNADGTPVEHWAVHASAFPTAFGVPEPEQRAQAADYLEQRGMVCSVYCAAFLIPALFDGGRGDAAFELLTSTGQRSWLNMIRQGAGATMEAWDPALKSNLTYSHPWAASPAFTIPRGLFGIAPTSPGFTTFRVRPQVADLEWAHVAVPTRLGQVGAAFVVDDAGTHTGVHVPFGSTATIFVPTSGAPATQIFLDGQPVPATSEDGYRRVDGVAAGCHILSTSATTSASSAARLRAACPGP